MFSLQHFNNFGLLLAGRLVGGIATSILCSNFESWLVCEHHKVSSTLYFHLLTTQHSVQCLSVIYLWYSYMASLSLGVAP